MEVSLQRTVNRPAPVIRAAAHVNTPARVAEDRSPSERRNPSMQVAHSNTISRLNRPGDLTEIIHSRNNGSSQVELQHENRHETVSRTSTGNSPSLRHANENTASRNSTLAPSEETVQRANEPPRPAISQQPETSIRERTSENNSNPAIGSSNAESTAEHAEPESEGLIQNTQQDTSPEQSRVSAPESPRPVRNPGAQAHQPSTENPSGNIQGAAPRAETPEHTSPGASASSLSPVKQLALREFIGIMTDSQSAENQVVRQSSEKKQWLRNTFENLQVEVESQLTASVEMLSALVGTSRDQIVDFCLLIMQQVTSGGQGILNAARNMITAIQVSIVSLLINISVAVQTLVMRIINQISGLLASIPIPDLHGLIDIRAIINGLISQVIGIVLGGLSLFLAAIRTAIRAVMRMVRNLISRLTNLVNQLISRVLVVLMRVISMVIRVANSILHFISNAVSSVLYTYIIPVLHRTYIRLVSYLDETSRQTRNLIRINRFLYQLPLLHAITGNTSREQMPGKRVSPEVAMELIRQLRRDAARNNRLILAAFFLATGGIIEVVSHLVIAEIRRIALSVQVMVNGMMTQALNVLNTVFNLVRIVFSVALAFIQQVFDQLVRVMGGMVTFITGSTNRLSTELLLFCNGAYTNVRDAIFRIIRSFLSLGSDFISGFLRQLRQFSPADATAGLRQSFLQNPLSRPFPASITRIFNMIRRISTVLLATLLVVLPLILINIIMLGTRLLLNSLLALGLLLLSPAIRLLAGMLTQLFRPVAVPKTTISEDIRPGLPIRVSYSVPLVNKDIQASNGEKLIFGVEATDTDQQRVAGSNNWSEIPGKGPYDTVYEVTGDAEFLKQGSGTKRHIVPGLQSRNIYLYISGKWSKKTILVKARLLDKAVRTPSGSAQDPEKTIEWTIIPRKKAVPDSLKKVRGPDDTFVQAPARYSYEGEPGQPPARPVYEDQTVLESFGTTEAYNFEMEDLKPEWRAANPSLDTPDKVAASVAGTSNNGTFVFDHDDRIHDKHSGFSGLEIFKDSALRRNGGVGYRKYQTYSAGGKSIGTAWIYRRYSKSNGLEIRKTGI